jgi:hypothetical protein
MVTCYLRYVIDPYKVSEFERYAKMWIPLVNKFGGTHHGYWLPYEGADNIAIALFSFPSLKAYEEYRIKISHDKDCKKAFQFKEETRSIKSIERSFMKPLFD